MKYLGNKERLLQFIHNTINEENIPLKNSTVNDFFCGTGSVSNFFLSHGCNVNAIDNMHYSEAKLYSSFFFNKEPGFKELQYIIHGDSASDVIRYLNSLAPQKKYFFENYAPGGKFKRQYFSDENAMKIDSIRDKIEEFKSLINYEKYQYLVGILIDAADLVSNTAGTYGAYLKIWRSMALKPLTLVKPSALPSARENKLTIICDDVINVAEKLKCDIAYIDPPYNSRQYAANFHVLENIVVNDKSLLKGVTGLRDYTQQISKFSQKRYALSEFEHLIRLINAKVILLSYSTEGIIEETDIKRVLEQKGNTSVHRRKYRRFKTNAWTEAETGLEELLFVCKVNK